MTTEIEFASPAAKEEAERAVERHGIELSLIKGTGKDGKLTKGDIELAVLEKEKSVAAAVEEAQQPAEPAKDKTWVYVRDVNMGKHKPGDKFEGNDATRKEYAAAGLIELK